MKKTTARKTRSDDDMREEYLLDYSKARPNRFAKRLPKVVRVIVLEADVADAFESPREINEILRAAAKNKRKAVAKSKRASPSAITPR
jgi:hypothetical protein